jgi:glycosyltransferase involved in cell wall biosynthesis
MRIAQVSPLMESVPPRRYGGTERVVAYLTEALIDQGHEVTLFASGDSRTRARLVAPCPRSLRLDPDCRDRLAHHVLMLEQVLAAAHRFDVIHFHLDFIHFPLARRLGLKQVTTLHGRLDMSDLVALYREFRELPLVSISNAQRQPLAWANWMATLHHGLPEDLYTFHPGPGRYLAFLGRMAPEKGVEPAIRIAQELDLPLRIAAKVGRDDRPYFERVVRPLLEDPRVEFIGEISDREKNAFLGDAMALLFPIDWPEPFGLVMIEAMACGTPVLGFRRGSVPELVEDGVTGYVVEDLRGAVAVGARLDRLDRVRCRQSFEERFTARRMARDYVELYQRLQRDAQPELRWGDLS